MQLESIGLQEGTFQYRLGDFKTYEVVKSVRGVAVLCHLHHVETKLSSNMSFVIVGVSDFIPILPLEFGKFNSDHLIDRRMPHVV